MQCVIALQSMIILSASVAGLCAYGYHHVAVQVWLDSVMPLLWVGHDNILSLGNDVALLIREACFMANTTEGYAAMASGLVVGLGASHYSAIALLAAQRYWYTVSVEESGIMANEGSFQEAITQNLSVHCKSAPRSQVEFFLHGSHLGWGVAVRDPVGASASASPTGVLILVPTHVVYMAIDTMTISSHAGVHMPAQKAFTKVKFSMAPDQQDLTCLIPSKMMLSVLALKAVKMGRLSTGSALLVGHITKDDRAPLLKTNLGAIQARGDLQHSHVKHSISTIGGCSGAPIFQKNAVVALHLGSHDAKAGLNRAISLSFLLCVNIKRDQIPGHYETPYPDSTDHDESRKELERQEQIEREEEERERRADEEEARLQEQIERFTRSYSRKGNPAWGDFDDDYRVDDDDSFGDTHDDDFYEAATQVVPAEATTVVTKVESAVEHAVAPPVFPRRRIASPVECNQAVASATNKQPVGHFESAVLTPPTVEDREWPTVAPILPPRVHYDYPSVVPISDDQHEVNASPLEFKQMYEPEADFRTAPVKAIAQAGAPALGAWKSGSSPPTIFQRNRAKKRTRSTSPSGNPASR